MATQSKALTAGAQTFAWDGRSTSGFTSANGSYSIKIVPSTPLVHRLASIRRLPGKVDGVDLSGTEPVLLIGNSRLPISSVQNIGAGLSTMIVEKRIRCNRSASTYLKRAQVPSWLDRSVEL